MAEEEEIEQRGCVYLAWSGGYFKIGSSGVDPRDRRRALTTGNPNKVVLVDYIYFHRPSLLERYMHFALNYYRHRGEWFDIRPELMLRVFCAVRERVPHILQPFQLESCFRKLLGDTAYRARKYRKCDPLPPEIEEYIRKSRARLGRAAGGDGKEALEKTAHGDYERARQRIELGIGSLYNWDMRK